MDNAQYSNFMSVLRGMARDIDTIIERLDKLIELLENSKSLDPIPELPPSDEGELLEMK